MSGIVTVGEFKEVVKDIPDTLPLYITGTTGVVLEVVIVKRNGKLDRVEVK